jgi:cytochrome c biogenesis factor
VVTIAPYTFRLKSLDEVMGPNYKATRADVEVLRDGQLLEVLQQTLQLQNLKV